VIFLTFFYDTQSLLWRYLTKLVRNPVLLGTNLGTPLLFLILFSQLLGKLGEFLGTSGNYLAYLTPGIFILNAMTGATLGGVAITNDLNSGFLSKMLLTQVTRSSILVGRLMTDVSVVIAQSVITLVVAVLLGVKIAYGFPGVLLMLVTVSFFELALSGIFLFIGMRTRKTETISAIGSAIFFPIIFISSAMFPVSFFPAWAQTISKYNPVSYASDVTRELVQGGLTWSSVVSAYSVIGLIALAAFAATLYQFRKVIS
jgi:ABC-2 type transport system permease protein